MATILHRCAWCPPDETPVPEGAVISHKICETCERKILAELEPTPESVAYESRPGSYYGHYGI